MDSRHEKGGWERSLYTYQRLAASDRAANIDRFRKILRYGRTAPTEVMRTLAKAWKWQLLLWLDYGVYLHPTRHKRVKKNAYGDTFRERRTVFEYIEDMQEEYNKHSTMLY